MIRVLSLAREEASSSIRTSLLLDEYSGHDDASSRARTRFIGSSTMKCSLSLSLYLLLSRSLSMVIPDGYLSMNVSAMSQSQCSSGPSILYASHLSRLSLSPSLMLS